MPRFRVAHIGAALGLFVTGAIGWQLVNAAGSSSVASSLVPITPCRLVDTRPADQVGARGTPLAAHEIASFTVWGQNGNCTIPVGATGIAANVTAVNPTAASYLTLFPGDATQPLASNLNWVPTSPPTPNQVTVSLSSSGVVNVFNFTGNVDVIIDIAGYYVPATGGPTGPAGRTGPVSSRCSATLRWDLPACKAATISGFSDPKGVAFDGSSIWVANSSIDTVSKIDPVTGARSDYATGDGPVAVAFDGTNIWVANRNDNTVSKIAPAGTAPGTPINYTTGVAPVSVAYDGANIWVANLLDNTVSKIDPNGVAPGTPINYTVGRSADGVAFDGRNIWVANLLDNTVSKIDPNGVAPGTPINYNTGPGPAAVAFDGTSIWVANFDGGTVSKIDPNGAAPGTPINYDAGIGPTGVAFDGSKIWVVNFNGNTVSKIDPDASAPGTPVNYSTDAIPFGIAFDGTNLWVTSLGSDTVSKIVP